MMKLIPLLSALLVYSTFINAPTASPILWTADFSPDGKVYAVGGDDRLLRIYNATDHKLIHSYNMPSAVQTLDWNADGKQLAIALDDKPVQIFNMPSGSFSSLNKTTGSRALAWNHNGQLLAVGDYSGALQVWSKERVLLKSIQKDNNKTYLSVDWHPSKNIILTGGDKIRIFDTTGNLLLSIRHRPEPTVILTVKWHPAGLFFATGDYGENENKIVSLLQYWKEDGTLIKSITGSNAEYRNIRWNKSGTKLATASDALRTWSSQGSMLHSAQSENLLWGIDWNNKNDQIIATDVKGKIILWNSKGELVEHIN